MLVYMQREVGVTNKAATAAFRRQREVYAVAELTNG